MPIPAHILVRKDDKEIPDNEREIRAVVTVYNEMTRLPYFLEYHRKLGVNRFLFTDNNSTDGTLDYLLSQPDCHVFYTKDSYSESKSGIRWAKNLADTYCNGYWCLRLDADELFVYPHSETLSLRALSDFMDQEGSQGLFTFMLDMYPKGNIAAAVCTPDKSFFDVAPYFDSEYRFEPRTRLKGPAPFPPTEVIGGPRTRCFYPDQYHITYRQRWLIHLKRRIIHHLNKRGIPLVDNAIQSPVLYKVPFVKWNPDFEYIASTHQMNPIRLSEITGVLAHFKFFSDFDEKVQAALQKGDHSNGSAEYKRYASRMKAIGNLMYEGSRKYKSSQQLQELNIIKSTDSFESYVKDKSSFSLAS